MSPPSPPTAEAEAACPGRVDVVVQAPVGPLTYLVPAPLWPQVAVGTPVRVPLGSRRVSGYVWTRTPGLAAEPRRRLRPIDDLDASRPALPEAVLSLVDVAARYYLVPMGEVLAAVLPAGIRAAPQRYRLGARGQARLADAAWVARQPLQAASLRLAEARPDGIGRVGLARAGHLTTAQAAAHLAQLVQAELLVPVPAKEGRRAPARAADVGGRGGPAPEVLALGAAQAAALAALAAALAAGGFAAFLLEGVTGSGKTEIYMRAIDQVLAGGDSALVLVPEIALTPQLGDLFAARFGAQVAIFHSGLTDAQRHRAWRRVAAGETRLALGARSALFLPLARLRLVVVDEEHETSFKQESPPPYHARDLALVRGAQAGAVVVLGSATPSLETHANAAGGRYRHLRLPERVGGRPLPEVERVDMGAMARTERVGEGLLSARLAAKIDATLAAGEQAIIFLNRRGWANYVFCEGCGEAFRCPDCDVSLTLHRRRNRLICHHCGHARGVPTSCPACRGDQVGSSGIGTERVERELGALFPGQQVVRLDRDTVQSRAQLEQALDRFRAKEAQLMVGTQMVAKGHDFPGVTLVGAVVADGSLHFPDFRAAERTFQILTQVAGRAGRGDRPGQVLLQGHTLDHYSIVAACRHDHAAFLAREMPQREAMFYPPFAHLALVRLEAAREEEGLEAAERVAGRLTAVAERLDPRLAVLGPAPAPIARLRGWWRFQVLVKSPSRPLLRQVLVAADARRLARDRVRLTLDVDPVQML